MTSVAFPILVDACVLIPIAKADLLLRMAMARQYRLLWSEEILAEVERNLTSQLGIPPEAARRRVTAMRRSFPDALVENYEGLIPAMTNEEKDRHVLAAAVYSNAKLIVTDNVRDFPPLSVHPYDIDVRTTDDFLLDQLDLHPAGTLQIVEEIIEDMKKPTMTLRGYICSLYERMHLPLFAAELNRLATE